MFRSPKDHPQGLGQALLKLPLCAINMYACVGDVGAWGPKHVGVLWNFSILMCVNMF